LNFTESDGIFAILFGVLLLVTVWIFFFIVRMNIIFFIIILFRASVWLKGHAPTDFEKWKTATENYEVCFGFFRNCSQNFRMSFFWCYSTINRRYKWRHRHVEHT